MFSGQPLNFLDLKWCGIKSSYTKETALTILTTDFWLVMDEDIYILILLDLQLLLGTVTMVFLNLNSLIRSEGIAQVNCLYFSFTALWGSQNNSLSFPQTFCLNNGHRSLWWMRFRKTWKRYWKKLLRKFNTSKPM